MSGANRHRILQVNSNQDFPTDVTLKNLTLADGYTAERGGAVHVTHRGRLTVQNVQFQNNVADAGGGAIFTAFEGQLTVLGSRFTGNRATAANDERGAGAIAFWGPKSLVVKDSAFIGNEGINGGAINSLNGKLTVENTLFQGNKTTAATYDAGNPRPFLRGFGGAIYTDRASTGSDATSGTIRIGNDYNSTASIRTDVDPQLTRQPDGTYRVGNAAISAGAGGSPVSPSPATSGELNSAGSPDDSSGTGATGPLEQSDANLTDAANGPDPVSPDSMSPSPSSSLNPSPSPMDLNSGLIEVNLPNLAVSDVQNQLPALKPIQLRGGAGPDTLVGGLEDNRIWGRQGADVLYGRAGRDIARGGLANDVVKGGKGNDRLYGNAGDDWLNGCQGRDRLFGQMGDDRLRGGSGSDRLRGGLGNDVLMGAKQAEAEQRDFLSGGKGSDRFVLGNRRASLYSPADHSYAIILDFDAAEGDRIVLHGSADDYDLAAASVGQKAGTGIFVADTANTTAQSGLIALVVGEIETGNLTFVG